MGTGFDVKVLEVLEVGSGIVRVLATNQLQCGLRGECVRGTIGLEKPPDARNLEHGPASQSAHLSDELPCDKPARAGASRKARETEDSLEEIADRQRIDKRIRVSGVDHQPEAPWLDAKFVACLSGCHTHPLPVVC